MANMVVGGTVITTIASMRSDINNGRESERERCMPSDA